MASEVRLGIKSQRYHSAAGRSWLCAAQGSHGSSCCLIPLGISLYPIGSWDSARGRLICGSCLLLAACVLGTAWLPPDTSEPFLSWQNSAPGTLQKCVVIGGWFQQVCVGSSKVHQGYQALLGPGLPWGQVAVGNPTVNRLLLALCGAPENTSSQSPGTGLFVQCLKLGSVCSVLWVPLQGTSCSQF